MAAGRWRLVQGRLELKTKDGAWAPVVLQFDQLEESLKAKGTVRPEMICMEGGPWPGCWSEAYQERRDIADCVPEQEDAVDPEEEEEEGEMEE